MNLDVKTIQQCNAEIRAAIEEYKLFVLAADNQSKSVNMLLKLCCEKLGKKIELLEINASAEVKAIDGFYLAMEDGSYKIGIKEGLNNCWKRFVICKELFHVLFDNPEYVCDDLSTHIEDCVSDSPVLSASPPSVQTEFLAEYAAMEFLFPFADRKALFDSGKPIDYGEIAQRYKVPRIYVERYLTPHRMQLSEIINKMG